MWFNLQGAERVSYDYQFRKKVLESSGLIVLHFNVVGVLNYNFATEPDSERYHLLPISDGFFSGFDTRLIDNWRIHVRCYVFADKTTRHHIAEK